ncbi:hypothetical protein ACOMHN_044790 [Nucella lapillus]
MFVLFDTGTSGSPFVLVKVCVPPIEVSTTLSLKLTALARDIGTSGKCRLPRGVGFLGDELAMMIIDSTSPFALASPRDPGPCLKSHPEATTYLTQNEEPVQNSSTS